MKQKHYKLFYYSTVSLILLLVLAAIFITVSLNKGYAQFSLSSQSQPKKPIQPTMHFSFNGSKVPIWIVSLGLPTNEDFGKTIAMFNDNKSCSIVVLRKNGSINVKDELQRQQKLSAAIGSKATLESTQTLTMQTNKNKLVYRLYQYSPRVRRGLLAE